MSALKLLTATDPNVVKILDQLEHLRKIHLPVFLQGNLILTAQQVATFIETAYWSSLLADEKRATKVRIGAVVQGTFKGIPQFADPVPFDEHQVAKLAPAVPPRGCLLVD